MSSIVDFIRPMDEGGGDDNWSCKMCKSPVKSSPPTNQHPTFYRPDNVLSKLCTGRLALCSLFCDSVCQVHLLLYLLVPVRCYLQPSARSLHRGSTISHQCPSGVLCLQGPKTYAQHNRYGQGTIQLLADFYLRDVVSAVYATATWLAGRVSVCHTPVFYQNG